jgi:tetratricopeptide (TPR) repeat protein
MGIRPLKLGGLSKDAVAEMLHGLSGREAPDRLMSLIFEESQGNPFFVEEVYRHLAEDGKILDAAGEFRTDLKIDETDVPENVRLIISRRLDRLDENEKRVLGAAAVIGRSFSFQLLSAICRIDVDELFTVIERAQQMEVIVPSSEGPQRPFTFAHELVRQTLLTGISEPRRQYLHAAVAEAIERLDSDTIEARAGDIANHLLKAGSFGDGRKLVRYLTLAGNSALKAAAFVEARQNFTSALSHQPATEVRERAGLLAGLATAELSLEHWDAALGNLHEALEIYTHLGDREMIGSSFAELTDALIWVGRFKEADETASRGLAFLGANVTANRAHLLAVLAQARAVAGDYKFAHEALREAFSIAAKLADPKLEARVLGSRLIVNLHFLRLEEAATDGLLSERIGGSESSPWQRALQLRVLHQALLTLGRLDDAIRVAGVLEPLAARIGQAYSGALCLSTRAWLEFVKDLDLSKLGAGFQEVSKSEAKAKFPFWDVLSEVQLSLLDLIRGDWASALARAQTASSINAGTNPIQGLGHGVLFRQAAYSGDRNGALALLEKHRESLPVSGRENTRGAWWMLTLVIEGLFMLGEKAQAGQLYPLVRELIDTGAVVGWPVPRYTQTIAALAAAGAHQWEAAEEHFRIAGRQAHFFPDRLEQAEIRRFHAMMLLDRAAPDDRNKAQTLLSEALETYVQIGMPRHIRMSHALLS